MHEQKTQAAGQEQHQTSNSALGTAWPRQGITVARQWLAAQAHAAPKSTRTAAGVASHRSSASGRAQAVAAAQSDAQRR
jgi:hypothetical protein